MVKIGYVKTPLKTIHENMILTKDGDIWAYYRIFPEETNPNNLEAMEKFKRGWANLFRKSLTRFKDFEIFMYPKDKQLGRRFEEIESDLAFDNISMAHDIIQRTNKNLKYQLGEVTEPDFVLGVRLRNIYSNDNPIEAIKRTTNDVTDKILIWLGKKEFVDLAAFEKVKAVEEELSRTISGRKGTRLTEEENVYLNRMNFLRNIEHNASFEATYRTRMTDTIIDPSTDYGFVHLNSDQGSSVCTFVPITNFENVNISYNHLFQFAQKMNFPCEFRIKAHYADSTGITGLSSKVGAAKRRYKNEGLEMARSGDQVTDKNVMARLSLNELSNELDNKEPIIQWVACFVVYGKNRSECKLRSDSLMDSLNNMQIKTARPTAKQLYLFYKFLQGNTIESMKDWVQLSNGTSLAETLFAVANNVGNHTGFYIGRVDSFMESETLAKSIRSSRNVVLFNILVANQGVEKAMTDSPHIAITGETGKGKSYLTKMLFFYSTLLKTKVLYIDPKKEMRKQFTRTINDPIMQNKYPEFIKLLKKIHYVTLDATKKENHGVLDPIVFLKDNNAKDTAHAMINSIYNMRDKDEIETAVLDNIDKVIEQRELGETVGLMTVVKNLMVDEDVKIRNAGKLLYKKIHGSILQLGFSDGETKGLSLNTRINVLEISGLDLPDQGTKVADYTDMNKKSVCLMLPLGRFCEQFGTENPEEYTIEIFDEAWIFEKAQGGKAILKSMRRVGRSMSNILIYSTQSVMDTADEEDHGNFGTIFAFDEPKERNEILEHVGLEVTERNIDLLGNMKKGQCFYKDIYNRVAKISVHNLFPEWDMALKTVKTTASSAAEKQFA